MKKIYVLLFLPLLFLLLGLAGCKSSFKDPGLYAKINTNKGVIVVKLDNKDAPLTVMNFVGLAEGVLSPPKPAPLKKISDTKAVTKNQDTKKDTTATKSKTTKAETKDTTKKVAEKSVSTKKDTNKNTTPKMMTNYPFYNGLTFHRVIKGTLIQGGDPMGNGMGGPGYYVSDEISKSINFDKAGVIGMANAGANTNGSQFFITLKPLPTLSGVYTAFGKVVQGMDVAKKIAQGDKIKNITIVRIGSQFKNYKVDKKTFLAKNKAQLTKNEKQVKDRLKRQLAQIKALHPKTMQIDPIHKVYYVITQKGNPNKPVKEHTDFTFGMDVTTLDGKSLAPHQEEKIKDALKAKHNLPPFVFSMNDGEKRDIYILNDNPRTPPAQYIKMTVSVTKLTPTKTTPKKTAILPKAKKTTKAVKLTPAKTTSKKTSSKK